MGSKRKREARLTGQADSRSKGQPRQRTGKGWGGGRATSKVDHDFIGRIYDAALNLDLWKDVQQDLARVLNSTCSAIVSVDQSHLVTDFRLSSGWDESDLEAYDRHYASTDDPIAEDGLSRPSGSIYTDHSLSKEQYDRYLRSEAYNEFFKPTHAAHTIWAWAVKNKESMTVFAFRRGTDIGPYGATEARLFADLLPHLQRSFQIQNKIIGLEEERNNLALSLDHFRVATFVVTEDGQVERMNAVAEAVISSNDGISVGLQGLVGMVPIETAKLKALIAQAARTSTGDGTSPGGLMRLTRPSGRRDFEVLVAPLPFSDPRFLGRRRRALLFVHDPELAVQFPERALRSLHGLSPAEARFAAKFLETTSIKECAVELGITENSARQYMKRILHKTDTNRQAELLGLLVRGLANLKLERDV